LVDTFFFYKKKVDKLIFLYMFSLVSHFSHFFLLNLKSYARLDISIFRGLVVIFLRREQRTLVLLLWMKIRLSGEHLISALPT